jgi:hypothetical protein
LVNQFPEAQEEYEWKVHNWDIEFAIDEEKIKPPSS